MSQLKNLTVITMFLYMFVITLSEYNIVALLIILCLMVNHIKMSIQAKHFDKIIINKLYMQREYFMNLLRHDLRIPIIAQIRALDLLKNENKFGRLNSVQKDIVFQTEDSCKYVLNLMNLMINTYNLENNSYPLLYEKFNVSDIIISCFDELSQKASEKNITFEYEGKEKDINLYADKEEFRKVILNILLTLISNAEYGRKLSINLATLNDKIRLTVYGNDSIQTHKKYSDALIYTSIGQTIRLGFCKKIIETHKGKILKNNNHNIFSFEIPLAAT